MKRHTPAPRSKASLITSGFSRSSLRTKSYLLKVRRTDPCRHGCSSDAVGMEWDGSDIASSAQRHFLICFHACSSSWIALAQGKMLWPDTADHVCTLVEIRHSGHAHHRESTLKLCKIFSREHFIRRSGTTGYDRKKGITKAEQKANIAQFRASLLAECCWRNSDVSSTLRAFSHSLASSVERRLPRSTPLDSSPTEIRSHVEVEGCTKDSVGERDRSELARFERGIASMRLKFMQQVPKPVDGISNDQGERKVHTQQAYYRKRYHGSRFQLPRR
jgi:hypothetical protein